MLEPCLPYPPQTYPSAAFSADRPRDEEDLSSRPPSDDTETSTLAPSAARPMRIQVFSDLHIEARTDDVPRLAPGANAIVVAGDTCADPVVGFALLRLAIPRHVPIVAVAGNHEFYGGDWPLRMTSARDRCAEFGVHFLEDACVVIDGVRFVGATLWTDYGLDGQAKQRVRMMQARDGMSDHRRISWGRKPWSRFRPEEALRLHLSSREYLSRTMAIAHEGPTVVVTHHAPHPRSADPRNLGDPLNAAYASDLTDLIATGRPDLWVHGHVHARFDYRVADTRIVCNPRGHAAENPDFDPAFVVEVAR